MPITKEIETGAIREELNRILGSRSLAKSPILSRFLRFIVEKSLDGNANQIKEYTVGRSVLDKPHNFNPQTDASVRIHGIRLRKMLEEFYQENPSNGSIRISIPKGGYSPSFSEVVAENNHPAGTDSTIFPTKETLAEDSICIIPFNGLVEQSIFDFSLEGFCGYLSEQLSKFQDIKVKSFFSVTNYLEEGGSLNTLGEALDVSYYLTGNVEIDKSLIKVSANLFDAKSNVLIWSQDFNSGVEKNSVSAIIQQVSNQIVASLGGYSGVMHFKKFSSPNHAPHLSNTDANAVFWFYHYLIQQNNSTFQKAITQLEQAVLNNPDNSLCYSVLSMLYTDSVFFNYATSYENPLSRAQAYAARALAINPECQHGNVSAGWINILLRNKDVAFYHLEKTFSINPNAPYFSAACCLGMALIGEYEKSKMYWEKTLPLHPMPYWWINVPPIFMAMKQQDYQRVLFYARKVGTPAGIQEHIFEMIALYYLDETDAMKSCLKEYLKKHPDGIEHAIQSWPMIIFDEDLSNQMVHALKELNLRKQALAEAVN